MLYFPIMEWWLVFALISLVAAGLQAFTQKVSAVRRYNASLFNGYSAGLGSLIGFVVAYIYEGFSELSWFLLFIAFLSGSVSLLSANYRLDSLRFIDTTISLPIHKFISPLFVLIIGIIVFNENLTTYEWLGIITGLFVPLLLINQKENLRQTNLQKGVILITISGLLSAVAFAINKEGTELFASVIFYVAVTQFFMAITATFLYKNRKPNKLHIDTNIYNPKLLKLVVFGGITQFISFASAMLALVFGGALAVVYIIQSLYIIIPILLSIIFFKEHWNAKKIFVIGLSIIAITLMR
jgi:drug/metabolite transporter (DMT)-like permease